MCTRVRREECTLDMFEKARNQLSPVTTLLMTHPHTLVQANNLRPRKGSRFPKQEKKRTGKQDGPSIWPGRPAVQWRIRTVKSVFSRLFFALAFFVVVFLCLWFRAFFHGFMSPRSCLLRLFLPMYPDFLQHVGYKKCLKANQRER